MNDVISKRILNASQKPGPLRLCHAAPDYNALTVSQLKTHTVICDSNSGDATDCSMNLVVELKVNTAAFWMLLVSVSTKQDVMIVGCACCIGSAAHPIRKA